MSCSTSRMLTPSRCSWRSTLDQRALFLMAQPGRRLVEQQQRRIGAQRARDLQQALRPHGQVAGQLVQVRAHADALELALRLAEQHALLGAVESAASPPSTPLWPRVCAPSATFSSTVMSGIILTCWKVRARPSRAIWRDGRPSMRAAAEPHLAVRQRQHAGDQVEGGGLAGAVGTDQADDLAGADLEADVVDGDQAAELLADGLHVQHQLARRGLARSGSARRIGPVDGALARAAAGARRSPTGRRAGT